jgi:hypothetical protein
VTLGCANDGLCYCLNARVEKTPEGIVFISSGCHRSLADLNLEELTCTSRKAAGISSVLTVDLLKNSTAPIALASTRVGASSQTEIAITGQLAINKVHRLSDYGAAGFSL